MPLPVFDNEADIPEAFRPDYAQSEDGKWRSKTEAEAIAAKAKQAALLTEKAEEKRLRIAAEGERDELRRADEARRDGVSETALEKIRSDEAAARQPILSENETLKAENRKLKYTDRVRAMALAKGVLPDRLDDAMPTLEKRIELGDADGFVFKDASGAITAQTDAQFFAALKTEKSWFFAFEGRPGGGSQASSDRGTAPQAPAVPATRHKKQVVGSL